MLNILKQGKTKELLVITPLLIGHSISNETKKSIKKNDIDFTWISYEGTGKHATNVQAGINQFKKQFNFLPKYIQIIDRDIILGKNMLDRLHDTLVSASVKSDNKYAFSYCPFEYKGYMNVKFSPMEYDIKKLIKGNYISSNSMYNSQIIELVGGFITDEKMHRMSDWVMFLNLYKNGYIGKLCYNASFIAMSTKNDISAGSNEEYISTYKLIYQNFIKSILDQQERQM